ncbi:hypothetical protein CRUP_000526 [Coryphaenoides rupestris]|nr:hypothetical protein CRUP_000526 [Coryphaenoides rupestris]
MMESEVFTPLLEHFMLTPLVSWVKTVGQLTTSDGSKLSEYIELVDGIYLNEVMLEMLSPPPHLDLRPQHRMDLRALCGIHSLIAWLLESYSTLEQELLKAMQ